jgi:hypothetical protein
MTFAHQQMFARSKGSVLGLVRIAFTLQSALGVVSALGNEEWMCTEMASIREGNTIKACGVSTRDTEEDARLEAVRNAKREFDELCSASSDCAGRAVNLEPLRNVCRKESSGKFTCFRGIKYTITEDASTLHQVRDEELSELDRRIEERQRELDRAREKSAKERELRLLDEQLASGGFDDQPGPSDRRALQMDFNLGTSGRDVLDTGVSFLITNSKYRTLRSRGALWLFGLRYLQENTTVERVAPNTSNPLYSNRPTDTVKVAAILGSFGLGYRSEYQSYGLMPFATLSIAEGVVGDRPLEFSDDSNLLWDEASFTAATFGIQADIAMRPKGRLGLVAKYMVTNAVYLEPRFFLGLNLTIEGPGPSVGTSASDTPDSSECSGVFPLVKPGHCHSP